MEVKDRIIWNSIKLFSVKGYKNTSVTDIITESNISRGGFYHHFGSKEQLFLEVIEIANNIWREEVLYSLNEIESPTEKLIKLLENYKDRYLKDHSNFPGGCIYISLSVELSEDKDSLYLEIEEGLNGLKRLLGRLVKEATERRELVENINLERVIELIFTGMIGSSVIYSMDKSDINLDYSISSLTNYILSFKVNR